MSDDEKRDSNELTYVEARPFLVDVKDDDDQDEEESEREKTSLPLAKTLSSGLSRRFWIASAVNTFSTVAIVSESHPRIPHYTNKLTENPQVFVNKRIFQDASLSHCQVSFAAFHFLVTYIFLYAASRPGAPFQMFQSKRVDTLLILPLALAMICNVVILNVKSKPLSEHIQQA